MLSRRQFIQASVLVAASNTLLPRAQGNTNNLLSDDWYMPEESVPHKRTWMAFIADDTIWAGRQILAVHNNIATIAKTIARYEPVFMLVRPQDRALAEQLLGTDNTYPIEIIETALNDLWIRDTGPSFVLNGKGQKAAVDFNFNGWEKNNHTDTMHFLLGLSHILQVYQS